MSRQSLFETVKIFSVIFFTVRSCETLPIPSNGAIRGGSCGRTYLSTCTFECNEGYRLEGSETRQCIVTSQNTMEWSGDTAKCQRK